MSQLQNPETIPERPKTGSVASLQAANVASAPAGTRTSAAPPQLAPLPDIVNPNPNPRSTVKLPPPPEAGVDMRAMYDYSDGTNSFKEGDIIRVVEKSGSWWGAYVNGAYCEVPANYLETLPAASSSASSTEKASESQANDEGSEYTDGLEAVAMFDYGGSGNRQSSQMLTFKAGEIIDLYAPDQEGDWWFGSVRGTTEWGYFPRNYCRVLNSDDYILVDGKWEYRDDLTEYTYDANKKVYVHNSKLPAGGAAKFGNTPGNRPLPTKPATMSAAETQQATKTAQQQQRQSVMLPKVAQRPQSIMISKPANVAPSVPENN